MSCSAGQIMKKSYVTKKGVKVASTCIMDMGLPGKGTKLFELTSPMGFEKYNYHIMLPMSERQDILKKALKTVDNLSLLKYMVALRTLNKSNKSKYDNLDKDVKMLQELYSPKRSSGKRRSPKRRSGSRN